MTPPCLSHYLRHAALIAVTPLMLVACNPAVDAPGDAPDDVTAPATDHTAARLPESPASVSETAAGEDGSPLRLTPLTAEDMEAAPLTGELGCSFSTADDKPLLIAKGNVADEPSQALIKVGGQAERLAAPGGFNAMVRGPAFAGRGHTARITLTGPATGGGESPPRPATLTYDRADGAQLVLEGDWTCGP